MCIWTQMVMKNCVHFPVCSVQNTRLDPEQYFTKLECISKGSFGEVYKGINNCRKKVVAIKIIDWEEAEDEMEDIQQEITVLSQCDSPFLTRYFGSYLKLKTGPLEEAYIATFLREILQGLDYLHSERKIHRDIKGPDPSSRCNATCERRRCCDSESLGPHFLKLRFSQCLKDMLVLALYGKCGAGIIVYFALVNSCIRPTAKELLRHKFITRYTKKTSYLSELIDLHRRWKSEGHGDESRSDDSDMDGEGGDQCPVWTFSLHCKVLFYEQMTARPQPHRQGGYPRLSLLMSPPSVPFKVRPNSPSPCAYCYHLPSITDRGDEETAEVKEKRRESRSVVCALKELENAQSWNLGPFAPSRDGECAASEHLLSGHLACCKKPEAHGSILRHANRHGGECRLSVIRRPHTWPESLYVDRARTKPPGSSQIGHVFCLPASSSQCCDQWE
ncbi:hypothetical protein P4O66_009800, partial [Electrophorus voltai]